MSKNVLIQLTINVTLTSVVILEDVENISIIGHNNPTIRCSNTGRLHFISCHHCNLVGITWNECGAKQNVSGNASPGLKFETSSSITIQNCTFQHSAGQAIVLSEISGDVNINHCKFDNSQYKSHGAAIFYTSNEIHSQLAFVISNCYFTKNTFAKSVVYIEESESLLHGNFIINNSYFYDNQGTPLYILHLNLNINGEILFNGNKAENGAAIYASNHSNITFCNNSIAKFNHNSAISSGGAIYLANYSNVLYEGNSVSEFVQNNAQNGGCISLYKNSKIKFRGNSNIQFNYNTASHGGALHSEVGCDAISEQLCNITFEGNKADFGGAAHILHKSNIIFTDNSMIKFKSNEAKVEGGAIYLYETCNVTSLYNAKVKFYSNTAKDNGGAICFKNTFNLIFNGSSSIQFTNNNAKSGGAISSGNTSENALEDEHIYIKLLTKTVLNKGDMNFMSTLIFADTSAVLFTNNFATYGGAVYSNLPTLVMFSGNATVSLRYNNADYGGALYFETYGNLILKGNSMVKFTGNKAKQNGGAVHYINNINTTLQEHSTILFNKNDAKYNGGALYLSIFSDITFDKVSKSNLTFNTNEAVNGGAIYIDSNSTLSLGGKSTVIFLNNKATSGGAVHCYDDSEVKFKGYINAIFDNNNATQGGAIYSESNCNVNFEENSKSLFMNNTAQEYGGALFTKFNTHIIFKEDSFTMFNDNNAINNGGSIYSESYSTITFRNHSTTIFNNNVAHNGEGGAVYSNINSKISYEGNSETEFTSNYAIQGGTIYSSYNSSLIFDENAAVTFNNSTAVSGGALYAYSNSYISFQGNDASSIRFINNTAEQYGGSMNLLKSSYVILRGSMTVEFYNNKALSGGGMYANDKSNITIGENSNVNFINNNAKIGGAIFTTISNITFTGNSSVSFSYNAAWQDGGALYLDDQFLATFNDNATVTFSNNSASDYGGAVYGNILESKIKCNTTDINFYHNHARTTGDSVFINVLISCNSSCLYDNILGIANGQNSKLRNYITTSPRKLVLYSPAYCIDDNENEITGCGSYYVKNIMLGQEILIDTCMYDYYDRPSDAAQFLVTGNNNREFYIPGSKYVLITCNNTFQGLSIIGNNTLPSNYTMKFTLYVNRKSEMKTISINLTVELVFCHPGYWYYPKSLRCQCYNASNVVFCSGKGSTIKRGYWFGSVTGKPTVTFCPINYCNFTCCETSNGYYHLSPVRDNQCRFHRSGTACGSCEESYTLSFDSAECIHVTNCSSGQTVLVVALVILYWVAIIAAVFLMMHFKINLGYLYAITYYYSVVDLMLSENWYLSNTLYTAINVMSSITKVTPQFLGQFCLFKGVSGIDQQFIHYVHPTAISLFLIIITLLARRSHKLSTFISKGIIHVICCLLLLSYTSVATTSLLLLRPLIFFEVDEVYTYVSPDIEYFHGRHLAYVIVAILLIIVIVIGLPLLLGLEPFLNSKINFVKVKPLLDQFQGCYKDRYRFFAAYYMVCRLVIILIIIANLSNNFIARYLLITTCVVISLIHQISKPYSSNFLNRFDGAILHLMTLVSVLPLVELFDSYDPNIVIGIAFVLVMAPSVSLFVIKLITNKGKIKRMIRYFYLKCTQLHLHLHLRRRQYDEIPLNTETSSNENDDEVGLVIDDSKRINATVCAM